MCAFTGVFADYFIEQYMYHIYVFHNVLGKLKSRLHNPHQQYS